MKEQIPRFMIIDDDMINNTICRKYIQTAFPDADIQMFNQPVIGLDHIFSVCQVADPVQTILLLDINMPVLSGWDVLDKLMDFSHDVKEQFIIYVCSSSVAITDKQKAFNHPLVTAFIEKPLTLPKLQNLYAAQRKELSWSAVK